jgi:hypothetical protein
MTDFDKALQIFQQDMQDPQNQSQFYDLFLNATLYIPTLDEQAVAEAAEPATKWHAVPLIIEAEGNDYLMLFDSEERLRNWAQAEVGFVEVPGHVLAATSTPPLHWALNVGSEPSKQFLPEEIAWLREVVERCDASAASQVEK